VSEYVCSGYSVKNPVTSKTLTYSFTVIQLLQNLSLFLRNNHKNQSHLATQCTENKDRTPSRTKTFPNDKFCNSVTQQAKPVSLGWWFIECLDHSRMESWNLQGCKKICGDAPQRIASPRVAIISKFYCNCRNGALGLLVSINDDIIAFLQILVDLVQRMIYVIVYTVLKSLGKFRNFLFVI
jgi:hypothetical protein